MSYTSKRETLFPDRFYGSFGEIIAILIYPQFFYTTLHHATSNGYTTLF